MILGDLPPRIVTPPPGPRARALGCRLADLEAPGVNTISKGVPPILWQEAAGANVRDVDDNVYIDLTSGFGVAAVGHRHPRVVAAVREQAGTLLHALGDVHGHPLRVELAARLVALSPVEESQVFFAVSGSEAVEIALKTALKATGRPGVLAFTPAYHGLTAGALAVTSRPAFRDPFAPHLQPHVHRLPFGCAPEAIEPLFTARGAESVGAVVVEPIVGREGVLLPPTGWLAAISRLATEHGALLVLDEIFTGFGRTGALFACLDERVSPDLLCCGKALGGGLPIAAVLGRKTLLSSWDTAGEALHTATFLANPLACAAALAVLDILTQEALPERALRLGADLAERLISWPARFPAAVTAVRGRGLLWGIELASRHVAKALVDGVMQRGVLILAGGPEGRVAQIVPPLTISRPLLDTGLSLLESELAAVVGRGVL